MTTTDITITKHGNIIAPEGVEIPRLLVIRAESIRAGYLARSAAKAARR